MPSTTSEESKSVSPKFQAPKKRKKWPRRLIILAVVIVLLALALRACSRGAKEAVSGAFLPAQAVRQDMAVTVTGTGTVKPNDSYRATTLLRGEIITAPFEEGDLVSRDQVLFTLDPTDAENNIHNAESGVERSKLALEQAVQGQDQAQVGLEQALLAQRELEKTQRNNEEDMAVKATADGVVTKVYIDPGDTVAAGTPIADILDRDTMELTVPFHAVDAATLWVGQSAQVSLSGSAAVLTGTISEIGVADEVIAGGAVARKVVIRVPNPGTLDRTSTASARVGETASAATGSFDYAASGQILALLSGKVETLTIKEGDRVSDGQVVGSFELPDLEQQVENAALAVRNARIAQENAALAVSNARLALSDAEEGLRIAQDVLEDYTITSPIDGTVIEKNYKAGDNIDPSTAATSGQSAYMAVIYDMSRLTFDMNVSELDVARLEVGQSVTFTSDAVEGVTFTGHVDKININGTTVSGNTNYPVTIVIDEGEGLYPGMNVSATILVEELGSVLCVPADAVQRGNTVYVAGKGALNDAGELTDATKLEERQVELGRADNENIEILSGLEEGETVYIPNQATNAMVQMMGAMEG